MPTAVQTDGVSKPATRWPSARPINGPLQMDRRIAQAPLIDGGTQAQIESALDHLRTNRFASGTD